MLSLCTLHPSLVSAIPVLFRGTITRTSSDSKVGYELGTYLTLQEDIFIDVSMCHNFYILYSTL